MGIFKVNLTIAIDADEVLVRVTTMLTANTIFIAHKLSHLAKCNIFSPLTHYSEPDCKPGLDQSGFHDIEERTRALSVRLASCLNPWFLQDVQQLLMELCGTIIKSANTTFFERE